MKTNKLKALGACDDARAFARKHNSYQAAWEANTRADWALWLLARVSESSRLMAVGLAADFAEHVSAHVPAESREVCSEAIDAARAYARDPSDENQERCRVAAAWAAAYAAYAYDAARTAANAATNAADAAYAANAAYDAARTAANAAHADANAAREAEKAWQISRILEVCPICPIEEGKE